MDKRALEGINTKVELSFEQRARAVNLESYVTDDEYNTAAEIIALRDALVLAVSLQGNKWGCSAGRGMERDCTCGWTDLKALAKTYAPSAGDGQCP
jgi:hypothetical protein